MKRLHIIGRKNHGKTTLVIALVTELIERGFKIGTIKHTHHHHELDTPGKDSYRHRVAGAHCVGILSPRMNACFSPTDNERGGDDRYRPFEPMFADCDLVIVEGDTETGADKIEVWRKAVGSAPIASTDPSVLAIVTDDTSTVDRLVLRRTDVDRLADWVCQHLQLSVV